MKRALITFSLALAAILAHDSAAAAPLPPASPEGAWSEPVGNLVGRIVVTRKKIKASEHFVMTLELRNVGTTPIALQTGNPFAFGVRVLDGAGKGPNPTASRIDVGYRPQWAVLPGNAYLGFPVSIKSADGAAGSHLDTTTFAWKLDPGTYRIVAEYSSDRFGEFKEKPADVTTWQGTLSLPAFDVEIEAAGVAAADFVHKVGAGMEQSQNPAPPPRVRQPLDVDRSAAGASRLGSIGAEVHGLLVWKDSRYRVVVRLQEQPKKELGLVLSVPENKVLVAQLQKLLDKQVVVTGTLVWLPEGHVIKSDDEFALGFEYGFAIKKGEER